MRAGAHLQGAAAKGGARGWRPGRDFAAGQRDVLNAKSDGGFLVSIMQYCLCGLHTAYDYSKQTCTHSVNSRRK